MTIRGIGEWFNSSCSSSGKVCIFLDTFPNHIPVGSLCTKEIANESIHREHFQVMEATKVPFLRLHKVYDDLNAAHVGPRGSKTDCMHWCVSKYIFEPVYHDLYKLLFGNIVY